MYLDLIFYDTLQDSAAVPLPEISQRSNLPVPFLLLIACFGPKENAMFQSSMECNIVRGALPEAFSAGDTDQFIKIQSCHFAHSRDLIAALSKSRPSILMISCCEGLQCEWLSTECSSSMTFGKSVHEKNIQALPEDRLRLVLSNVRMPKSCSDILLQSVDHVVTFTETKELKDEKMAFMSFIQELFAGLGRGISLQTSLDMIEGSKY
jgi:hypothetical protein